MSEDRYPILVERFKEGQSLVVACQVCPWETKITPDEIRNERNYHCPRCGGSADYKYEEADHKCPNCGKLGFFGHLPFKPNCSRVCALQTEWAQELAARRGATA